MVWLKIERSHCGHCRETQSDMMKYLFGLPFVVIGYPLGAHFSLRHLPSPVVRPEDVVGVGCEKTVLKGLKLR